MANSYVEYSTAGTGTNGLGQNIFSYANIDALSADDIKCLGYAMATWNDVPISNQGALTDASTKKITLTASDATAYSVVRVYRSTTAAALVDFVDGARLTENDLDTAYKQGLFVAQEVSEDARAIGTTSTTNLALSGTTSTGQLKINNGSAPATPTGGGILYVESGALKYKGSSGSIATLGAA